MQPMSPMQKQMGAPQQPGMAPQAAPQAAAPPGGAQPGQPGHPDIGSGLDEIKKAVSAVGEEIKRMEGVEDNNAEVLREVASATGVDASRVQTCAAMAGGQHSPEDMSNQNSPYMASAGKTSADEKIAKLEAELEKIRNEKAQTEMKSLAQRRMQQAAIIAKGEVYLREGGMTRDQLNERIKYYNELKNDEDKLVDLTLTATKYQQIIDGLVDKIPEQLQQQKEEEEPITVSAAGLLDTSYPVGGSVVDSKIDYNQLEDSVN